METTLPGQGEIVKILSTHKCSMFQYAYDIHAVLEAYDGKSVIPLWIYVCRNFKNIESSDELLVEEAISREDIAKLKGLYGKLVNGFLETALQQNMNEDEFYAKLWRFVANTEIFDDKTSRVFSMYYILIDKRIPYYSLSAGLRMSNENFRELLAKHQETKNKIRFLMAQSFDQKTERASILLSILDEIADNNAKTVLLAFALEQSSSSKSDMSQLLASLTVN